MRRRRRRRYDDIGINQNRYLSRLISLVSLIRRRRRRRIRI